MLVSLFTAKAASPILFTPPGITMFLIEFSRKALAGIDVRFSEITTSVKLFAKNDVEPILTTLFGITKFDN